MKKIYSFLFALLTLCGVAQAQTLTWVASEQGYANAEDVATIDFGSGVTATLDKGTNKNGPKYYDTGSALRLYGANTITISGAMMSKIEFTLVSGNAEGLVSDPTGYTLDGTVGTWKGEANSVSFTREGSSGHVRIAKIEITLKNDDPNYVATPKITPSTGTYYSAQTVTITCDTEGATIYYTTDDSSPVAEKGGPSETAIQYSEPFVVEKTTTIKAVAIKDGPSSKMAESEITIEEASTQTIAEIIAAGAVDAASTTGTVVAICKTGFLLGDGTAYIFVYTASEPTVAVGDVINITGKISVYGGCLQFSGATIDKTGTAEVVYPTATVIDGAAFDALVAAPAVTYVEVAGTISQVGNYSNFTISGATATGSILATADVLASLTVGNSIKITGFFVYQSVSKGVTYGNVIATKVDLPEVEYTEYNTIAAVKAAAPADEASATYAQLNVENLLVSYVNGQNVYLFDGTDGMLIFGTNSKNLKTGDKISGAIKGKLFKRYGNTQIANPTYEVTVTSSENEVVPQEVSPAVFNATGAAYENELITLKGLVPNAEALESKVITFKFEDEDEEAMYTFTVRDNFGVASAMAFDKNKAYTVTGLVAIYTKEGVTTIQIYPRTAADIDNGEEPTPYEFVGNGTLEKPYTVEDIQHKEATDTKTAFETNVWVKAFIVGYINGSTLNAETATFNADGDAVKNSNILVADAAGANVVAKVIPIGLATGGARTDLNLADNPSKLGTQVWLKGDIYKYMGYPGLKNVKVYSLDGQTIVDAINDITIEDASAAKTIYTVAGQRVQNLSKAGLYIVNGKKVVVK